MAAGPAEDHRVERTENPVQNQSHGAAPDVAAPDYAQDLGGGLRRRWSMAADQERIGACLGAAFRSAPDELLNQRMLNRTRVMFDPGFPLMDSGDYALVEDMRVPERPIVACACLWRQRWSLGGISLAVGRPEYVASAAEYRNRGLVRSLFEMLHTRSEARGDDIQIIFGIPYYYRQFGYEYALDLWGLHMVDVAAIPTRKAGEDEAYTLRPAVAADVPTIETLYGGARAESLAWCEVSAEEWGYYITAWDAPHLRDQDPNLPGLGRRLYMLVDRDERSRGFAMVDSSRRSDKFSILWLALEPTANWQTVMPSLLRGLQEIALAAPAAKPDLPALRELAFLLGRSHPAYTVLGNKLAPYHEDPYAWYIRVPDVPGLVRRLAPMLEARLAASVLNGYDGELVINFYRGGLRLRFAGGKLTAAEPWQASGDFEDEARAGCPGSVFTQLLFGYKSLAELRELYPDVWANEDAAVLLDILLPRHSSHLLLFSYT